MEDALDSLIKVEVLCPLAALLEQLEHRVLGLAAARIAVAPERYVLCLQRHARRDQHLLALAFHLAELELELREQKDTFHAVCGVVEALGNASHTCLADPSDADVDHDRCRLLHGAIVGDDRQNVIMARFMRQRLRVADGALVVDGEGLIDRENLVFADIAEERRAVLVGGFDANYFLIQAPLVNFGHVRRL